MGIGVVELLYVLIIGAILIFILMALIIPLVFFNRRLNKLEARLASLEQRDQS